MIEDTLLMPGIYSITARHGNIYLMPGLYLSLHMIADT